jgi:hypothetical protein
VVSCLSRKKGGFLKNIYFTLFYCFATNEHLRTTNKVVVIYPFASNRQNHLDYSINFKTLFVMDSVSLN